MPLEWPRGAQDALEFHAADDIGGFTVFITGQAAGIEEAEAHGQNHGAHLQLALLHLIVVFDGFGQADFLAEAAADAGVAVDAVGQGHRLGVSDIGGRPAIQAIIKFIDRLHRAGQAADAATGTLL